MSRTIWNRPLDWGEAELHFPGCGAAWDMVIEAMVRVPETPNLMAVWSYDHVPCDPEYCGICALGGNELVLTARIGESTKLSYDVLTERWYFTGGKTV